MPDAHFLSAAFAEKMKSGDALLMGIVNLTPDSFSGDGRANNPKAAIDHANNQWQAGADILDIGAESTRPGATPIDADEEWRRLSPVLTEICQWKVPVSVDTRHAETMQKALALGVFLINDIDALSDPAARVVVAKSDCFVSLMHRQGSPENMQKSPRYTDVVREIKDFLAAAVLRAEKSGISRQRLIIDPGFGFGKTTAHNLALLRHLKELGDLPILVGLSRKQFLGDICVRDVSDRLPASLVAAFIALQNGAKILRVHDVAATCDTIKIWQAVQEQKNG